MPFGLKHFEDPPGVAGFPADPLLGSEAYAQATRARSAVAQARRLLGKGDAAAALGLLDEAAKLNPGHYLPYLLRGKAAFDLRRWAEAEAHLAKAQALYPAFGSERQAVQ